MTGGRTAESAAQATADASIETSSAPARVPAASWYALAVLTGVNVFASMDRLGVTILLQDIKTDLGVSDRQIGMVSGLAFALFYSTMGLPLARIADRGSRVKLLSACLMLWTLLTAVSGMARNFAQLFAARMGVGVGEAGCVPTAHSLIGDLFSRERRALAISIFTSGGSIGTSGGMLLVGFLGEHYGWRTALQVVGLAGAPLALLVYFTVREPVRRIEGDTAKEPAMTALRGLLRRPALVHLIIAYGVGSICTFGVTQWAPTFLIRSFGLSMTEVGAWSGLATVVGGVAGMLTGGFVATWLAPRDPRWELWLPAAAYLACAPVYALMFLSPVAWLALLMKAGGNFFAAMGAGVVFSAVQSLSEPHRRATAVSLLFLVTCMLGLGLGPYLIGLASDLLTQRFGVESLRYALLLSCGVLLWSIIHFMLAARTARQDRAG
jgi:predicted MFS family arabinose efflux permease